MRRNTERGSDTTHTHRFLYPNTRGVLTSHASPPIMRGRHHFCFAKTAPWPGQINEAIILEILRRMPWLIFVFFPIDFLPRTWTHFCPKLIDKPSLGRIFRTFGIRSRALYTLVWSVHDELVHVYDCATSFIHSAWFG